MWQWQPTHRSHKEVEAYPIKAAEFEADGSGKVGVEHATRGYIVVPVPAGFLRRAGTVSEGDMLVRYEPRPDEPHGYLSHSPRIVFEAGYSALPAPAPASREPDATGKPAITRAEADASLPASPAPRVTLEAMEAKVVGSEFFRSKTLTICILTLANGFTLVGKSACASPENYDRAMGERYAYDDAFRQMWAFEAYLLRERLAAA